MYLVFNQIYYIVDKLGKLKILILVSILSHLILTLAFYPLDGVTLFSYTHSLRIRKCREDNLNNLNNFLKFFYTIYIKISGRWRDFFP